MDIRRGSSVRVAWTIAAVFAFLDRLCKALALFGVTFQTPPVTFALSQNRGILFGIALPLPATIVVSVAVLAALGVWYLRAPRRDALGRWAGAALFLGATSNLFDRVRYGFVVDYLSIAWWPGAANVADGMIIAGIVLLFVGAWRRSGERRAVAVAPDPH